MPDNSPNAEEFGRISLYRLRNTYAFTEKLFGRAPYLLPNSIIEEYELDHFAPGSCCGPPEDGYPLNWSMGDREEYLQRIALTHSDTEYLKTSDWSDTLGHHELTHRFVLGLNLSSFLNEGLANYAQDWGANQSTQCKFGGYETGDMIFHKYDYHFCAQDTSPPYETGDCLWQRIENQQGIDTVRRIIGHIYNKQERDSVLIHYPYNDGTPYATYSSWTGHIQIDLNQAFIPELGEAFWTNFSDFGLSKTMADGLTYDDDRAYCAQ